MPQHYYWGLENHIVSFFVSVLYVLAMQLSNPYCLEEIYIVQAIFYLEHNSYDTTQKEPVNAHPPNPHLKGMFLLKLIFKR